MTAINQTTKMMGIALRQARIGMYIPHSELALLLKISEPDLTRYENGEAQLPMATMQMLFSNAYTVMRARYINNRYREYIKRLQELGALDVPEATDIGLDNE